MTLAGLVVIEVIYKKKNITELCKDKALTITLFIDHGSTESHIISAYNVQVKKSR